MIPLAKQLTVLAPLAIALAACSDPSSPTAPAGVPSRSPSLSVTGTTTRPIVLETRDLGPLEYSLTPVDINELGDATGMFIDGSSEYNGFLWRDGRLQGLEPGGGFSVPMTVADDMNNAGQIVGSRMDNTGAMIPFVWQKGVFRSLQLPDGTSWGFANGVNDAGQAVGELVTESGRRASVWSLATAAVQDLGTLGGTSGGAVDINGRGDIAANRLAPREVAVVVRGASWQELGDLGGHSSKATAINELGQIAGWATRADGVVDPFFWHPTTGTMQDLGTGSYTSGIALGLNDLGQAVGMVTKDAGWSHRAVIWQDGEMYELGDVGTIGPTMTAIAADINDAGQILGRVTGMDSRTHLVLWTVPLGAAVDVEPGDAANTIALGGKGTVTAAVLTTPFFDAQRVVPASLTLGDDDLNDTPVLPRRDGSPSVVFKDVDRDGDLDLVAQFDKDVLRQKGDLTSATTRLVLRGQLQNGKPIRGSNAVSIRQ